MMVVIIVVLLYIYILGENVLLESTKAARVQL